MYFFLEPDKVIVKLICKNFPNLGRDLDIHIYEANRLPSYPYKKTFSKAQYNELSKSKIKRILKAAREEEKKKRL